MKEGLQQNRSREGHYADGGAGADDDSTGPGGALVAQQSSNSRSSGLILFSARDSVAVVVAEDSGAVSVPVPLPLRWRSPSLAPTAAAFSWSSSSTTERNWRKSTSACESVVSRSIYFVSWQFYLATHCSTQIIGVLEHLVKLCQVSDDHVAMRLQHCQRDEQHKPVRIVVGPQHLPELDNVLKLELSLEGN